MSPYLKPPYGDSIQITGDTPVSNWSGYSNIYAMDYDFSGTFTTINATNAKSGLKYTNPQEIRFVLYNPVSSTSNPDDTSSGSKTPV